MYSQLHEMVLRADRPTDEAALRRLAALDSVRPIRGRAIVAEVEGRTVAAIGIEDGKVVADPFEHTAEVVELLRSRVQSAEPKEAPRHRLMDRFRGVAA